MHFREFFRREFFALGTKNLNKFYSFSKYLNGKVFLKNFNQKKLKYLETIFAD